MNFNVVKCHGNKKKTVPTDSRKRGLLKTISKENNTM